MLLPFQELAARTGATLKWFDLDDEGRILANTADEVITERTKIVAVTLYVNAGILPECKASNIAAEFKTLLENPVLLLL